MEGMSQKTFEALIDSRDRAASWPITWFVKPAESMLETGPSPAFPRSENDNRPTNPITEMIAAGRFICQAPFPCSTYKTQQPGVKIRHVDPISPLLSRLLSIDVEPNLFQPIRNRDISFRRRNDDGLSRCRGSKLLREIHLDSQHRSLDRHLNVLHDGNPPTGSIR